MANPNQGARSSQGRYVRTPELAERDAEAARLFAHGYTDGMIAQMLGYPSLQAVQDGRKKILKEIQRPAGEEVIAIELQKLDMELVRLDGYERAARTVLDRLHVTISHGKIVNTVNPDTEQEEPLLDDGPVLQAIDRLVKIEDARRRNAERRAKLLGLDAAVKVDATVHEVTQQDVAIQELVTEMRAKNAVVANELRAEREQAE